MRSFISALVLAASFSLLVPDHQTLRAAESFRSAPAVAYSAVTITDAASASSSEGAGAPSSGITWLLAFGFLAAIISRRLGSE